MSTVKIKTEPIATATTAATATVNVQVKLEPSLSTSDIKLEQHTSDIDTKHESDSEADGEESDIKSENDEDEEDTDQNQTMTAPKNQQYICKYSGCGRGFSQARYLKRHQHEHRLQTELNVLGRTYILARESLDDRWSCPFSDCEMTHKSADGVCTHIRRIHVNTVRQQQAPTMKTRINHYFVDVDYFYVNGIRYGYHRPIGVFICYECRLVPECLLTHLQQKHGFDDKSIENAILPERARIAGSDPNINQHISNPLLAAAIRESFQQQHPDIIRGWLCVKPNCGSCYSTKILRNTHQYREHKGEQPLTVPAIVLRLLYGKARTSCFLITRLDKITNSINWNNIECDEDDGDELVLSDMGDELVLSDYSD